MTCRNDDIVDQFHPGNEEGPRQNLVRGFRTGSLAGDTCPIGFSVSDITQNDPMVFGCMSPGEVIWGPNFPPMVSGICSKQEFRICNDT